MLTVRCPRPILNAFKRHAKAEFNREIYAVLIGTLEPQGVRVKDIWYPQEKTATEWHTRTCFHTTWFSEALAIADSAGLVIVGDLHSHCYEVGRDGDAVIMDRAPSECDWDGTPDGWIRGICCVLKKGKRMTASARFWPAVEQVRTILTK